MLCDLICDSEAANLPVPDRFFAFAYGYRDAADALCQRMVSSEEARTWPNSAVVLMLAAHATELFIKGALLTSDPTAIPEHHRIDELSAEYRKRFPNEAFEWDIPFGIEYPGMAEAEIDTLKKTIPVPSILYRYPVAQGGKDWRGIYAFEPHSFAQVLGPVNN